ncbi:MAG: nickel pincer cofactor biosynthesis protein LarB [Nitrosopumilus sp. H8]|nr:MAG: nickel pincer cofactor biosynthesis protein LarB [Nitrosopumilus sp. H8]
MELDEILESLKSGKTTVASAKKLLSLYSIEEIEGIAKIDVNRQKRRGVPEVILAETKGLGELKKIIKKTLEKSDRVVVSRIKKGDYSKIVALAKSLKMRTRTGRNSSTILIFKKPPRPRGAVGILAAGTSDVGVAEEARLMCEAMNCRCVTSYDVGVAGIQRMFPELKKMVSEDVGCVIVVAGMEGALATLVSALVDIPVIGVPVSVGYGYGKGGVAALASMLQSCSLGLAVVNIDGGIAAGGIAANIANRTARNARKSSKRYIP